MAIKNRFSALAKPHRTASPIAHVKQSGPAFAHPVPATVDRDKKTGIERHEFEDGSARHVRPGQHGHGMHKRPTSEQAAQAKAAQQAKEAARMVRAEPQRVKSVKPVNR